MRYSCNHPNKSSQQNKIWCLEKSYSSSMQLLVVRRNLSRVCIGKMFGSKEDQVFSQVVQAIRDIIMAGERALVSLYGGAKDE